MASRRKPTPSFTRNGSSSLTTTTTTTTTFFPPSAVGSFAAAASASAASTPQGTPPPPHFVQMDTSNVAPTIYTAVYSGVSVFEMTVNNVAVMRRRHDSWLNATQILKVAGVDKGKRTKVLEREILTGDHEKVQGGYGKYQGTWIDFQRGRDFCRAYGVEDMLAPLLDLDIQANGGPESTPTKEQAMAAKRKRMYNSRLNETNGSQGPLFPPISSTVTNAFSALSKSSARIDSPAPSHRLSQIAPSSQNPTVPSQEAWPQPGLNSENSFSQSQPQPDSTYASQNLPLPDTQPELQEPPRKRARASTPSNDVPASFFQTPHLETPSKALSPVNLSTISNAEHIRQTLMNLFIHPEDTTAIAQLDNLTPDQIDIPLDPTGSAAVHWAASLARVSLIRALVSKGASIYRVNDSGETALVRGCFVTNNFDQSSFPQLLNLLHPTIPIVDNNGRTILHHIAVKSGMKGRSADSRYYLHCLLEFVAKNGATSGSGGGGGKVMSLARFIGEIVNAQDKSGDTALNIAARIGNKSIIQQLLEVGADSSIPNRAGLRPIDFGVGGEPAPVPRGKEQGWVVPQAVVQRREDIVSSMKNVIADIEKDFQAELSTKQSLVSSTLNQLREVTLKLGKERERMETLRAKSREHSELCQHTKNLRRAITEELSRFSSSQQLLHQQQQQQHQQQHNNQPPTTNGNSPQRRIPDLLDPDAPYRLESSLLPIDPRNLTSTQKTYLSSLPPPQILKARITAYKANQETLKDLAAKLQDRSIEVEDKFRRVVALCTGVEEAAVDSLLGGLVMAVESDPGMVDEGRVSSFLRKVEGGE